MRVLISRLAAAADELKRRGGATAPFALAFVSDRTRVPQPEPILSALPEGAAFVYRDYDDPARAATAARYRTLCAGRGVLFILAGDAALAAAVRADGLHLPARMLAPEFRKTGMILTAACHDASEIEAAARAGADAAFLSPVFATKSHPDAEFLGPERFRKLAASAPVPVLALGGVDALNARLLAGTNVAGFGAIGAFAGADQG